MNDPLTTQTLGFIAQTVETGHDDQQQQIDALEAKLNSRTTLLNIEPDGKKVRFTFIRNGKITAISCYADMALNVGALRKELVE